MHRSRAVGLLIGVLLAAYPLQAAEGDAPPRWKPSPTGAALRSLVLPGWGQAYTGHPVKSVFYTALAGGLAYSIYKQEKLHDYSERVGDISAASYYRNDRNRLGWYLTGSIILAAMDAFVDAHLYDFDVSPDISVLMHDENSDKCVNLNVSVRF